MEREQGEIRAKLDELSTAMSLVTRQEGDIQSFMQEVGQYATIDQLDEGVLNRLISRILVGEVQVKNGEKVQEVRIVYNFVGEIGDET